MKVTLSVFLCGLCLFSAAYAAPVKLAERTPVKVTIMENLVSGQGKPDDEITFQLSDDIYGPGHELLATKGTPAYGHIIRSKKHGIFGKSGKLDFSCDATAGVDGTKIPLRGTEVNSGKSNGTAAVATAVVFNVLGVLINGKDVSIKKGTEFTVYIDADTMIDPNKGQVAEIANTATYSVSISPTACQELAKKIKAALPVPKKNSVVTFAITGFELRAEKESMKMDPTVNRNACDDLTSALDNIKGFRVIDPSSANDARYVISGSISDRGSIVVINAKVVSTITAQTECNVTVESPKK